MFALGQPGCCTRGCNPLLPRAPYVALATITKPQKTANTATACLGAIFAQCPCLRAACCSISPVKRFNWLGNPQ